MSKNDDFSLPQYGYLAFDALSMKAFLRDRLNKEGVFTDQNYEGSNISQVIDIFAYTFHTLIYYMNKTASEGLFSDAQIYENLNRIVKSIGYNPIGRQTSVLTYTCRNNGLSEDTQYILPRYSYIAAGGSTFSFKEDITFTPSEIGTLITDFSNRNLLYQGKYVQYPVQIATGQDNEIFYLNPGADVLIDHFTIDVYVKKNGKWSQWTKTPALYLNNASDDVYELRLNEKKYYEIKFGNDINGTKLADGDQIAIFYLQSDGVGGVVGAGAINESSPTLFSGDLYDQIMTDVRSTNSVSILDYVTSPLIKFFNDSSSTYYSDEEDVDSIRENAPGTYRAQYRLVTKGDFENFVKTNFANLIHDTAVINNWEYLSQYLSYFYSIGLVNPNNDGRVLLNQVNFADACNFNNVYIFAVPKIKGSDVSPITYLTPALKSMVIQSMDIYKCLTSEPVMLDPIYMAFDIALPKMGGTIEIDDITNTKLYITRKLNSRRDFASIKADVTTLITDYFKLENTSLGQTIDISKLNSNILAVDGVETVYTGRTDDPSVKLDGVSFIQYNPIYPTDKSQISYNNTMHRFQFPYLLSPSTFSEKIEVISSIQTFEGVEY